MKELTAFRVEPKYLEKLRAIKKSTGVSISVQVNLAIRNWVRRDWKSIK